MPSILSPYKLQAVAFRLASQTFSSQETADVSLFSRQILVSFVLKKHPNREPQHKSDPKQVPSPEGPHAEHLK